MWTLKTKRGVWLHSWTWVTPVVWMRGIRTRNYFIGVMKADDGYPRTCDWSPETGKKEG